MGEDGRTTPCRHSLAAALAGAGLGVVDMALAWWSAGSPLHDLARDPSLRREDGAVVIDPGLLGNTVVPIAMTVVLVHFLIAAVAGFIVARRRKDSPGTGTPMPQLALALGYVVFAPVFHFVLAGSMVQ